MSLGYIRSIVLCVLLACTPALADWDTKADTWVATDALGRSLPGHSTCGDPRAGKTVGIFYFLWLGIYGGGGPYDITKILAANPTDPQWGPSGAFHHWGEAELGYYRSDDEFVMRKHCQMLTDAGIDVVILDATNGDPYTAHYMKLCQVYQQIRSDGGKTPQICFFVNWENNSLVQRFYNEFYSQNLYPDLWFHWLGKPLILTKPDGLSPTLLNFFTFRKTWAWSGGVDNWSWIDYYPQTYSYHTPDVPEEISVSIAQQYPPHSGAMSDGTGHGRNWHNGAEPPAPQWDFTGHNFAEQWQRALEVDPPLVFVTGWNEWVAQRLFDGAGNQKFYDEYTQEFSRDIEPMKDGHTDSYYYQLVRNVRRYKGVRLPENPSAPKTIAIDGDFSDWDDVAPDYKDDPNDTMTRNTVGWDGLINYVNTTGRNDIIACKTARDAGNIYFYVQTKDNLTSHTSPNWMLLFIDSDRNKATGWQGYDYLINYSPVDATTTTLKHSTGGWNWTLVRDCSYDYSGNKMEIRVPRSDLGLTGSRVTFDFHWADNIQKTDDIIEFSVSGDSAPNRRFDYRYDTAPGGPEVLDVTADRPSGTYGSGQVINVQVAFTSPVYVTGTPQIELIIAGSPRGIDYASGSGTSTLSFAYTVQLGDDTALLDYSCSAALLLNGGTIKDAGGLDADLRLAPPGLAYSLGYNRQIAIEATAPAVTNVTSSYANGIYRIGQSMAIRVEFSEDVLVTGSPKLLLETGATDRNLSCTPVSGNTLNFPYTVQTGDTSPDLDYVSASALTLPSGASIKDVFGNPASLALPQPGAPGSLGYNKDLAIDGIRPRVTGVTSIAPDGPYCPGSQIDLVVNWDEPVLTTGTPYLGLETGAVDRSAYYLSGSGTSALAMRYTVEPGDTSADLDYRQTSSLVGTIRDMAGNNGYTQLPAPGLSGSLAYNKNLTIRPSDGSIADAKRLPDGSPVGLGAKSLYLEWPSFAYIEEQGRWSGVRVEGAVSGSQGDLVSLSGTVRTSPAGERYIEAGAMNPCGTFPLAPLGTSQRALLGFLSDGLYVKVWGAVKPGSVTPNSYVLLDGSDPSGITVITPGLPGVIDGQFVTITGAAGWDGQRVLYLKQ